MRLVLTKRMEVPPEGGGKMGFRYTHPEDGHVSHSLDQTSWLKAIKTHRENNNYPAVDPAAAIDQLCKLLPPGWCRYESGAEPKQFVNTRLTVADVVRGTKALLSYVVAGMPLVSKELATSRSETCARCYFNLALSGCKPCYGLQGIVDTIGGRIKTPSDASLRNCALCKCNNKAQTRLPIEFLTKGITKDELQRYPDFCWKLRESELTVAG